jgi:hypothetical protein
MKVQWNIDLTALMNKRVELETKEGHVLTGKLTRFNGTVEVDGETVEIPLELGLDNSWSERVPFTQLVRLQIAAHED